MKLSIRAKIFLGFAAIFVISMVIGIYGLYSINKISDMSAKQTSLQKESSTVSDILAAHYVWRQGLTLAIFDNVEFTGSYDPYTCALGKWRNSEEAKTFANDEILALLEQIITPHHYIHSAAEASVNMMKAGQYEEARKEFMENILPNANNVITLLTKLNDQYKLLLEDYNKSIQEFQARTLTVIIGLIIFATLLSIFFAIFIVKSIMSPLRNLADSANKVADGNFNVNFKHGVNDEIGKLTISFASLVNSFKMLIGDMNKMADKHGAGETDYFIDTNAYHGEFQDVACGINSMISSYGSDFVAVLDITQKFADGDFTAKLRQLPGKKAAANTVLDNVSTNLKNVEESVMFLVKSAMDGVLDKNIDESGFKGGWQDIISGMNNLLKIIDAPLVEAQEALSLVSEGNLNAKITGKYSGQFEKISISINKTIEVLSTYILEISTVLNQMAADNYKVTINREYVGNFTDIKVSLNAIIERLNAVMNEIKFAADHVAIGAGQISDTGMTLSQGSTEQASSVEELNATIDEMQAKIVDNAKNTAEANKLADIAKKNAEQGNNEMTEMLKAMSDINEASQGISKIIKVIEDIAFQTNLLALNAAVEAARAGDHGKGFAVVAEEVRSLAARSQDSAKETANLIKHSITKVDEGTKIANDTAGALSKIVDGVKDVSEVINKIEASSKEQAASIIQISEGINNISQVAQTNSATSEESAAAAEELNSQSEMLKQMINKFVLKV